MKRLDPNSKRLVVYVSREVHNKILDAAYVAREPVSQYLRRLVELVANDVKSEGGGDEQTSILS